MQMNANAELYYNLIVRREQAQSFINCFDTKWNNYLASFDLPYSNSKQLMLGNRLRPILCCWGYMYCHDAEVITTFEKIAEIAVSVEAIHKASVIIDDVIDGDNKRRGVDCFHIEFGEKQATFFAVCLLSGAIKNIANVMNATAISQSIIKSSVNLLCDTIIEMCVGAISEIEIGRDDRCNLQKINKIIHSETVALLRNSFLIGYMSNGRYDKNLAGAFSNIGSKCGYIFQVMNDLEPFCNPNYILSHKGNLNSDCLRSRKNIVIPYLFSTASHDDCLLLKELLDSESNYGALKALFNKYRIRDVIFVDINDLRASVFSTIERIPNSKVNLNWKEVFPIFVDNLIKYCMSILDGKPKKW